VPSKLVFLGGTTMTNTNGVTQVNGPQSALEVSGAANVALGALTFTNGAGGFMSDGGTVVTATNNVPFSAASSFLIQNSSRFVAPGMTMNGQLTLRGSGRVDAPITLGTSGRIVADSGQGILKTISQAELAAKCASGQIVEFKQVISFPKPQTTCAWGTDAAPNLGNLGKKDQRVSARLEQDAPLGIPDNALLCSLNLDFIPDGSAGQQMYYDDEIFMTFNNVILAASQSYNTEFTKKDGFMVYDWASLVGKRYGQALFEPYCAGADSGQGECFIPPTETNGIMKVKFSDAIIQKIAVSTGVKYGDGKGPVTPAKSSFKFSFVTIGDNDDPADCKHSDFGFQVAAKYVVFK
jgi:hypothetical protein